MIVMLHDPVRFGLWQDTWCKTCSENWHRCKALEAALVTGESDAIKPGPGGSEALEAYCTSYEPRTIHDEIQGVPA